MSLWIYKCTNHNKGGGSQGDWNEFFARARKNKHGTAPWGGPNITSQPGSHALAVSAEIGQQMLCWQIWDRRPDDYAVPPGVRAAAVGIVELVRIRAQGTHNEHWELRPVKVFEAPVPLTTYRASDPLIDGVFAFPRNLGTFDALSPAEEKRIRQLCGVKRQQTASRWDGKGEVRKGGGFGDPEQNEKVEAAAVKRVSRALRNDRWKVRSVEQDKVGYDLVASRSGVVRHIEVKGVSGSKPDFIITANERKQARKDPHWEAWIVTDALTKRPKDTLISGADLQLTHDLKVIAYRATAR